jgi:hypothetical protein
LKRRLLLGVLCVTAPLMSVTAQPPQTPGQIRPRPGQGRDPEFPTPKTTEFKPKSTLVVAEHPRPRAKFSVVDIHSHQPTPISADQFDKVVTGMAANNLRLLGNLSGSYGDGLRQGRTAEPQAFFDPPTTRTNAGWSWRSSAIDGTRRASASKS